MTTIVSPGNPDLETVDADPNTDSAPTETLEPLETIARKIERCVNSADEQLLEAARLISVARTRVKSGEVGEVTWDAWVEANLTLKPSRVRELERIGRAEEPRAALLQQRQATAARQDKFLAKRQGQAPLYNGAPEGEAVAAAKPMAAPAAEPRLTVVPGSTPDPDREELRHWVDAAPAEDIKRTLDFTKGLAPPVAA